VQFSSFVQNAKDAPTLSSLIGHIKSRKYDNTHYLVCSPPRYTVFLSGPYIVTIILISAAINILALYSENKVFRSKTNGRVRSPKKYITNVSRYVEVDMAFCISVKRSQIIMQVTRSCVHSSKRIPALGLKLVQACYTSHTFEFLNHMKVDVK